jgi:hypothetical protein
MIGRGVRTAAVLLILFSAGEARAETIPLSEQMRQAGETEAAAESIYRLAPEGMERGHNVTLSLPAGDLAAAVATVEARCVEAANADCWLRSARMTEGEGPGSASFVLETSPGVGFALVDSLAKGEGRAITARNAASVQRDGEIETALKGLREIEMRRAGLIGIRERLSGYSERRQYSDDIANEQAQMEQGQQTLRLLARRVVSEHVVLNLVERAPDEPVPTAPPAEDEAEGFTAQIAAGFMDSVSVLGELLRTALVAIAVALPWLALAVVLLLLGLAGRKLCRSLCKGRAAP